MAMFSDHLQICKSGHLITRNFDVAFNGEEHCERCGKKTFSKCIDCGSAITSNSRDIPENCSECGTSYPWNKKSERDNGYNTGSDSRNLRQTSNSQRQEKEVFEGMCSHDSRHKEAVTNSKSGNLSLMGSGVGGSTTNTKIVCKKCGKEYEVENAEESEDYLI